MKNGTRIQRRRVVLKEQETGNKEKTNANSKEHEGNMMMYVRYV
jgi:hypothetical protein